MNRACLLLLSVILPAWSQSPSALTVKAATNKKVDLTWSGVASGYTVQRRTLGGSYATIGTVTTAAYSDTSIDPYTTYQYQALANGTSTPSNQVTVGPPPSGFTVVAPAPGAPGSDTTRQYGADLNMALDGNGDPAFAWIYYNPSQNSDPSDSQLLFRSWNRAQYTWNPIVKIAVVGDAASYFHNSVSLAYDSSTNTWAAASETTFSASIKLFFSTDGGVTWINKSTFQFGQSSASGPSLAMASGNIHFACLVDHSGPKYITGKQSADPTTWTTKTAPVAPGTDIAFGNIHPSLAMDSTGTPAIAYWVPDATDGYNNILLFWKPSTSAAPVRVMDSQKQQSDELAVKMVFAGLNPRILVYVQRTDADFGVGLHFVRSDNGGATWQPVIVIPPDGTSSTDYPFDLAIDSQGHGAIGFGQNGGTGDETCGRPKLSRSDDLVKWTTCAAGPLNVTGNFSPFPGAIQVLFGGNDKLYYAWQENDATPNGIYLYREPPAGAANAPSISSVVNGATFQPGIVAGSWVTITGANLADTSRIWGDSDFNRGNILPTNLSGTSVKINGLDAPVYYISPTQINVQAPAGITGNVSMVVTRDGVNSNTATAGAVATAPGLFTYSLGGKTYPSALYNGTYTIVGDPVLYSAALKAKAGDIIQLYATGLGSSPAGNIIQSPIGFSSPVTATLGTTNVSVLGTALVAVGEFQINIQIPQMADGEYPLLIKVNGIATQTGVIIPVGK
jgi:uncharacterized protein (TIGR03437 family)